MNSLSNKPSEIINQALNDLIIVENNPKYVIDMGSWHSGNSDKCYVCLAGAVMANTYQLDPDSLVTPERIKSKKEQAKLYFLDAVRVGDISTGLASLGQYKVITEKQYLKAYNWIKQDSADTGVPYDAFTYQPKYRNQFKKYLELVSDLFKAIDL